MTLRGFHIIFITLSVLLAFSLAAFEYVVYSQSKGMIDGVIALVSALFGLGMASYGVWFIRKPADPALKQS